MNKLLFASSRKLCALAAVAVGAWLVTSCADTYSDDESFESSVRNTQLSSPAEADIKIEVSTDGMLQTISWPVVHGAGGYEFKLYVGDEVSVNDTIDGCSRTVPREEDTNYRVELRTLGNAKLNNTEAGTPSAKSFSTFTATYAAIPTSAGQPTDLAAWFESNPIPEDSVGMDLNFDLDAGGQYVVSKPLSVGNHNVVLRTSDKYNHAVITLADGANFVVTTDFTLKYVDVECAATRKAVLELNTTPEESLLPEGSSYYRINNVRIQDSNLRNVVSSLIYDNNKSYCVANLLISNTAIKMTTETDQIKNQAFVSFQGGGVKDFVIQNSTVWQAGEGNPMYFIRYNNSARVDRFGWDRDADHTTMTYNSNTFYKVASGNWGNYSGISNYSLYTVQKNIWVDCGDGQIARRILGNSRLGNNSSATWSANTYWRNGEATDMSSYDTSLALTTDPAFANPDAGDFTPTGAEQVERQTGDPRWLTQQ